eukprot:CAMPEP_0183705194 /NCGR_PEP_ID=MMETSP0737-20130205/2356_1 /TAXON_ID=385413 /ORGANISM="Thalassiosira miniscula, Strain CCMP1093" /LENGTH=828 /DNA_ID=CAMNT_0025932303 /DNA_START=96 /DNA_END=2582 /DNA_ORIENTATION=+
MAFGIALTVITLASASMPSFASSASSNVLPAPKISIQELRSALSSEHSATNLHEILHDSRGILRIALGGENEAGHTNGFSTLRQSALSHLCDCPTFRSSSDGGITFEEALEAHPKDLQQINLPDGTVRRTLGSAAVGFDTREDGMHHRHASALELPSWVQDTCGKDAYDSFEGLRDAVAETVGIFVERLDQENKLSQNDRSYQKILSGANHLEHFHVYTKSSTSSSEVDYEQGGLRKLKGGGISGDEGNDRITEEAETSTLDYHTDAGFFLSFVPAMNCHTHGIDSSSFYLEGHDEPLTFGDDEVIIMLGAGAQYWLPSQEQEGDSNEDQYPFLAASHALRLSPGTHRAWYGKMHLLPSSFTTMNNDHMPLPSSNIFGEAFPSFQLKDYDAHVPSSPVDGCGTTAFNQNSLPTESLVTMQEDTQISRRRLQHINSPASCNNQTDFFCWFQCVPIPNSKQAEEYVYNGYSLYCLDPGKLSSSDDAIAAATDPCEGGYIHNSNCVGSWQITDEDIPGYKLPYEVKKEEDHHHHSANLPSTHSEGQYCYGGTSMYMEGFTWKGSTCVIYLFPSLVLSSPTKFALAAIGTILFGIVMEFVLLKRRSVYSMPAGYTRLCLSACVYGLQLSMGYFIMLVVMTYSGPLVICAVGGMMVGHACFNAQDSLISKRGKGDSEEKDEPTKNDPVKTVSIAGTELSSYHRGGPEYVEIGIAVGGMTCSMCVKTITGAVMSSSPNEGAVQDVKVELSTEYAVVKFSPGLFGKTPMEALDTIVESIEDAGYDATVNESTIPDFFRKSAINEVQEKAKNMPSESIRLKNHVPEGVTPCCQYTL